MGVRSTPVLSLLTPCFWGGLLSAHAARGTPGSSRGGGPWGRPQPPGRRSRREAPRHGAAPRRPAWVTAPPGAPAAASRALPLPGSRRKPTLSSRAIFGSFAPGSGRFLYLGARVAPRSGSAPATSGIGEVPASDLQICPREASRCRGRAGERSHVGLWAKEVAFSVTPPSRAARGGDPRALFSSRTAAAPRRWRWLLRRRGSSLSGGRRLLPDVPGLSSIPPINPRRRSRPARREPTV